MNPKLRSDNERTKDWLATDTAINALRRAQFDVSDILRRAQGNVVGAFGLDPQESLFRLAHIGVFAIMAATTNRDLC